MLDRSHRLNGHDVYDVELWLDTGERWLVVVGLYRPEVAILTKGLQGLQDGGVFQSFTITPTIHNGRLPVNNLFTFWIVYRLNFVEVESNG